MEKIQVKRIYDPASKSDGFRVLVDRIWPRGLSKDAARIDLWMKEIAPTTELRKWFNHDPARWTTFQEKYRAELRQHAEQLDELRDRARKEPLTLLYGAKDTAHNQAVVLRDVLAGR